MVTDDGAANTVTLKAKHEVYCVAISLSGCCSGKPRASIGGLSLSPNERNPRRNEMRISRLLIINTLCGLDAIMASIVATKCYPYRHVFYDLYMEGFRWLSLVTQ